jgi:hypothetical protein
MTEHGVQNKYASNAPAATYESFVNALNGLHNDIGLGEALREIVKRSATTARGRSADLHAGATKATGAIEHVLVKAVSGVAETNRKVANAALQEIETACATVDKLADAKSFDEVYRTYFDYLRHQNEVGQTRAKIAAGFVSAKASEAFDAFRDSAARFVPTWLRAA